MADGPVLTDQRQLIACSCLSIKKVFCFATQNILRGPRYCTQQIIFTGVLPSVSFTVKFCLLVYMYQCYIVCHGIVF